jgi:parvulin-like peptidyl-prolyl isomerase
MEQALAQAVLERELQSQLSVEEAEVAGFYRNGTDLMVNRLETELARVATQPGVTGDELKEIKDRIDAIRRANLALLEKPERRRIAHLMLSIRTLDERPLPDTELRAKRLQIEKLSERAHGGEDFSKLIKLYSEDRRVADTGGEYTVVRESRFSPEFIAAVFSLAPGQVSDIVTTPFAHHLIKLLEVLPASKVTLEEATPEIREFLLEQRLQQRMPSYFARLKQDAGVEVLDSRYQVAIPEAVEPLERGTENVKRTQ